MIEKLYSNFKAVNNENTVQFIRYMKIKSKVIINISEN